MIFALSYKKSIKSKIEPLQYLYMRGGPVYIVKPKYIFKHPFNKYDLANPSNRQTQNQELTDYFNYGFNEDTMNIYGKLVKRFIQVLDHHKNLQYFNEPSELMRLNDQIPMDFGGFGKFHDPWIVDNQTPQNFHDGETLMRYFVMMIYANASRKVQYPLIQYIKNMYKKEGQDEQDQDSSLYDILEQIGKNLQQRYQETMKKLQEKANQAKNPPKKNIGKEGAQAGQKDQTKQDNQKDQESKYENINEKKKDKLKQKSPQKKKKSRNQSSDQSQSEDSSDQSDASSESKGKRSRDGRSGSKRKDRKKDKKRSRDRDRDRDRDRKKKDKKDKNKSKKVKKQKSHKRSRSRDKKKKHH